MNSTKVKLCFLVVFILWIAGFCLGQEPASTSQEIQKEQNDSQPGQEGDAEQESIPVPIREREEIRSLGEQTFSDDVFQNPKNHWGFSLSAYQAYSNDVANSNQPRLGSGITAFMPRTFINLGRRKSQFHVDLGAGYRIYNKNQDLNSFDYYGDAQYSLKLSKRTSLQLSDQFISSHDDSWSFISLYSPIHYNPLSSNEVLFNKQRVDRNSMIAEFNHQASRRIRFGVLGGFRSYRYHESPLINSDAFDVGGNFYFQAAKWLYFSSTVSTYVHTAGPNFPDAEIYRVEVGGLELRLSDFWRIWAGGGFDISDYSNRDPADQNGQAFKKHRSKSENVNAGIGHTSPSTAFALTYQRGFTSAIGISQMLRSDVVTASLGHRITRRLNAQLEAYYYRSSEPEYSGFLETLSGGGGLEIALRRDLMLTMNVYYQNQRTHDFSVSGFGLGLNRFTAYLGLQYVWPSLRRTGN